MLFTAKVLGIRLFCLAFLLLWLVEIDDLNNLYANVHNATIS